MSAISQLAASFSKTAVTPRTRRDGHSDEEMLFMRRVGMAMYFSGVITLIVGMPLGGTMGGANLPALEIFTTYFLVGGLACAVVRHPSYLQTRICVIYGILGVSAMVATLRPLGASPYFYLWPMLFSSYFLSRRDLLVDLAITWVTLGIAVFGFSIEPLKEVLVMGIGVSVTLTCAVVMFLRERLTSAIGRLEEHDHLTKLPNRMLFHERVGEVVSDAIERGKSVAVAIVDLDQFREINDTLGHNYGDGLLTQLAARLNASLAEGDAVARLGGDEFGLILHDVTHVDETLLQVRDVIEREIELDGIPLSIQGSIGYVLAPRDGIDTDQLLQRADVAMYVAKAKHSGVVEYAPELNNHDPANLSLIGELRHAIDAGELVLHYQPQASISGDLVEGVEALVRWNHPTRGLIYPDQFLFLAEQTDLIERLTAWVLHTAVTEVRDMHVNGSPLSVSINVSARSISRDGLAEEIIETIRSLDMAAHRLQVEVTETALLADPERAADVLAKLAQAGVRVSLDDFGCGQTSLSYLAALPIDELKIDRSFVMGVIDHPAHQAIVRSIIYLAHNLGLRVVGEGIETDATLGYMRESGCDIAQGFLLARPMPAAHLASWLASASESAATDVGAPSPERQWAM